MHPLIKKIQQGPLVPIYLLVGSEMYLKDQLIEAILNRVKTLETEEVDINQFEFHQLGMTALLEEANSYSFFSSHRILIVDDFDPISTKKSQTPVSDHELNALLDYLAAPNPQTILILIYGENSLDKRKKITKALLKNALYLDCQPMQEQDVVNYAKHFLKAKNISLTNEAFEELLFRVDYQLTPLVSELTKLELVSQNGGSITVDIIQQLVPRTLETDVFELTDAVVNLKLEKAIQIYEDLLLNGEEPIALHALLISQFRLFIQVHLMKAQGYSEKTMAKELSVHPYRVKLARQKTQKLPLDVLIDLYERMAQYDYNMKQGIGVKDNYFYLLLSQLADAMN